ncbi:hypothetical protein IW261DRAFT_1635211 [Armillaria novae-zelandiae]|uniref:Uncharacterized protein n=1 Tax=Armillaria novae-zelandiae TaxID=153914 RepID=A0AA39KFQ1_9AGAR|nr:hypothetical protein IW261DRAFT_1635211 [Armillaria novae-zelandiae]
MSTRVLMFVLGLGASIEAPGIGLPVLPPTLVEFSRTLIHLEPDTKTNASWQVIIYLHIFVVSSGELAWTRRNRAQSHVAANFKCIVQYACSSEEVCKAQDHISPSGKPWHNRSILSWFPCPIQSLSILATLLSFEYMDHRLASKNANLARQIPHSQGVFWSYPSWMDVTCTPEPSGFKYMKHHPVSKILTRSVDDRALPPSVQSCLKHGLGASCTYPNPNPDAPDHSHPPHMFTPIASPLLPAHPSPVAATLAFNVPPPIYVLTPNLNHTQYYDYNCTFTGASSSTFHPSKHPRSLTKEEAAAITCNLFLQYKRMEISIENPRVHSAMFFKGDPSFIGT